MLWKVGNHMKIGMIGHKRFPEKEGGVDVVVGELSIRMAKKKQKVSVYNQLTSWFRWESRWLKRYCGVQIYYVPMLRGCKFKSVVYAFSATIRAIGQRYDIIHFHGEGPCMMIPIAKLFGISTVATIHGLDWKRGSHGKCSSTYLHIAEKILAKFADEIIVLSRGNQRYFSDVYNRKTRYVTNGVTVREPRDPKEITERYGIGKEGYLLYVSPITREKGLHYLIEAYKKSNVEIPLVIAGKLKSRDSYVSEVVEMAKGNDQILFTGFVEGTLLDELYTNAKGYILPSEIEGMPMSLLEALSFGIPCLASDIGENVETAGKFSRYFENGNVEDLKKQIEALLIEEPIATPKEQLAFVRTHYNWDKATNQTLNLYRRILRKKNQITRIYLIRHGTTDDNVKGVFQGRKNVELGAMGKSQVEYLCRWSKKVALDAVYTSPLRRAEETAEALCKHRMHLAPIWEDGLIEIDVGDLEGKTRAENLISYPEQMRQIKEEPSKFIAPQGESSKEVYDRMVATIDKIVKENEGDTVAVVSHGFAIQLYLGYVKGIPFEEIQREIVGNASITCIEFQGGKVRAVYVGEERHLPESLRFNVSSKFMA